MAAIRLLLVSLILSVIGGVIYYDTVAQPSQSASAAVAALNGGEREAAAVRESAQKSHAVDAGGCILTIVLGAMLFSTFRRRYGVRYVQSTAAIIGVVFLGGVTGCMKDFDTPEYGEVDTAETAFLVPLEGDTGDQAKFQSEKFLDDHKVAAKRVQITHRFSREGRLPSTGKWIPSVRLIKVNRSPVTREWTAESGNGTANNNQAIWVESADSVGFSMGFTVTGHIVEDDSAKFLYWYPTGSLEKVMDTEIRARVQQDASEVAAEYPLDDLRAKKQEIIDSVRKDVTAFFKTRGITITTIGMFGGMTYENPKIQSAIDDVFIAQQLKNVAKAKFEAQQKMNEQVELEAQGLQLKALAVANGEAKAIAVLNEALSHNGGPQLMAFKQLDMEKARIEKWDGKYPTYFMGGGSGSPNLMVQMPATSPSVSENSNAPAQASNHK